ncbi:10360_t:CDS:2, partial [Acaulospora morrowiae]
DLDYGDSRKRDHNAEDCPRKSKFSQRLFRMKRSQSDENGKLKSSSKDSKSEPSKETMDDYPSEILEKYYKETTAEPPDKMLKSAYNEVLIRDNVIMEKKEENNITGEPTDTTQRPYCNKTATDQGSTNDQLRKTMIDYTIGDTRR